MRGNLLRLFFLFKYCICNDVQNFDGEIRDFVVGNSKLFVLTDRRLHQMRHDLSVEKTKDLDATHPDAVTLLVPFEANDILITCGTSNGGYCEVLDLNDVTNSIYWESKSSIPERNEKSVAFIVDSNPNNSPNGAYLLVGRKDDSANKMHTIVALWNTLDSQPGTIFSPLDNGSTPFIRTERYVEFIDGFQISLLKLSYLFLNAKTESGSQAFALRLNNAKGSKKDILRSITGTMLKCCNDKSRPVLIASAFIPSDKAVIWTGVFRAQNDLEDTALAVYDLTNVDGKVKDFCFIGETCSSQGMPVAVVFKYNSMSSVAAVRSESWTELFVGTKDGQLIKVVLDESFSPGCPTVLYRSDDDQEVLPRMHLDPVDNKHIYIALKNQIRRVPVVQCVKHNSLRDCRAALDPLCGWCVETRRCSTQDECLKSSWISFPNNSIQKPLLSFQVAEKSSREMTLHLTLRLDSTRNPAIFSCTFTTAGVNLCDRSDPPAVFPNCSCGFSDQLLSSEGLEILASVIVEDQKITETLMLKNCPTITDNSPKTSYAQCVQCVSAGCHWSSSVKRCDWTQGPEPQLQIQDVCKDLHYDTDYKVPETFTIKPNRVSFHGRNNVLLTGSNLGSVTKIRIQGDLDCIPNESPVFGLSSDSLRFHVPPSKTKGTAKVCAVTEDDRCHGNSIITYSSQPSCTGIQPKVTWRSGGRKIHVQGNNMEFVESIIVHPSNKEIKTQYNTSSKDLWFYTHPYDGNGLINLMLKVGNVTLNCASLTTQPDPEFIGFTTAPMDNDVLVIIKGIVMKDEFFQVFPLVNPAKKVLLSNVPPFISDGIIEQQRQLFMILNNDVEELNIVLKFKVDGFDYVIFATTETMKCFKCGTHGHLARMCTERATPAQAGVREQSEAQAGTSTAGSGGAAINENERGIPQGNERSDVEKRGVDKEVENAKEKSSDLQGESESIETGMSQSREINENLESDMEEEGLVDTEERFKVPVVKRKAKMNEKGVKSKAFRKSQEVVKGKNDCNTDELSDNSSLDDLSDYSESVENEESKESGYSLERVQSFLSSTKDIRRRVTGFYKELYRSEYEEDNQLSEDFLSELPQVEDAEKPKLGAQLTESELDEGGQGLVHLESRKTAFRLQFVQKFLFGEENIWKAGASLIFEQRFKSLDVFNSIKKDIYTVAFLALE
ncbi:uncharacterized protein [Paramisgurnus dabryanus]|uniref:uncharacterized protein n=1 Tax=Paramisgurnus dabryanus TaxID=90735 RepID=UPI0031F38F1F